MATKRKIGDYEWQQISMWDLSPEFSISKYVPIGKTGEPATYILCKITKVDEDGTGWSTFVVKSDEDVPKEVLEWRDTGYYVNINHKSTYHECTSDIEKKGKTDGN